MLGSDNLWNFAIDSVVYGLILLLAYYIISKIFVRSNIWKMLIPTYIVKILSGFFKLSGVSVLCDIFLITIFITVVIYNEEKVVKLLKRDRSLKKFSETSLTEKKALYKTIDTTVTALSSSKIGAIMTFERNNSLEEYIKTGVKIDAPVKAELLTTIFYPGTTLHDGAVIIRGNNIEAASVYYTPTTRAMRGKYGARHRASLGISEVCDAITVVISEETGRISIAMDGELQAVNRDNFLNIFKDVMEREI